MWLNEAQRYIALQTDYRGDSTSQTIATVSGTSTSALPSDFCRLINLRNTDDQLLLNPIELRDFDEASASSGKPTSYVVITNSISFYPTPDAVYNLALRYWKMPADMTADSDAPAFGDRYAHLYIHYCLSKAFARENDYQASQFWRNEFERDLQKLRGEAQTDVRDGPTQVKGAWDQGTQVVPTGYY